MSERRPLRVGRHLISQHFKEADIENSTLLRAYDSSLKVVIESSGLEMSSHLTAGLDLCLDGLKIIPDLFQPHRFFHPTE